MGNIAVDYEFLILEYLKSYKLYHTKEETIEIMKKMINKEDIDVLPNEIKYIKKNTISNVVSKFIIKLLNKDVEDKKELISLLPTIIENNMTVKEQTKKKKRKYNMKRVAVAGIVTAITLTGMINLGSIGDSKEVDNKVKIENTVLPTKAPNRLNITDKAISTIKTLDKEKQKLELKKKKLEEKKKVLTNYKKIETIDDIYKRQEELESLNLKKDDKVYKNCKLSPEIQRFIEEQSIVNELPTDFTFSIISTETRGDFNSTGTESYNAPGDYDLGLTQQNTVSSVVNFCKKFNISYDEAYELIRDNDYFNVVSAFLEYDEIRSHFDNYDSHEFAGCYNGWLNWENKRISRQYVEIFDNYYDNHFNDNHDVKTKEEDYQELSEDIKMLSKKINA